MFGNLGISGNFPPTRVHPRESAVNLAFPITAITRDDGDPGDLFLISVISEISGKVFPSSLWYVLS
jgi:hypothetical protein